LLISAFLAAHLGSAEGRAIKVLDSDAHARDFDNDIRKYLPEPYRSQKASFIPSEHYDRNLGGTLGQSGAKVEDRLAAMDLQQIDRYRGDVSHQRPRRRPGAGYQVPGGVVPRLQ
jgi:hypothetical protein